LGRWPPELSTTAADAKIQEKGKLCTANHRMGPRSEVWANPAGGTSMTNNHDNRSTTERNISVLQELTDAASLDKSDSQRPCIHETLVPVNF
jgi:hypothetical protein